MVLQRFIFPPEIKELRAYLYLPSAFPIVLPRVPYGLAACARQTMHPDLPTAAWGAEEGYRFTFAPQGKIAVDVPSAV